jgi:hypothetical protein
MPFKVSEHKIQLIIFFFEFLCQTICTKGAAFLSITFIQEKIENNNNETRECPQAFSIFSLFSLPPKDIEHGFLLL